MPTRVYRSTALPDGTVVSIEDNGGDMIHLRASKGKYHRALPLYRAEATIFAGLLVEWLKDQKP